MKDLPTAEVQKWKSRAIQAQVEKGFYSSQCDCLNNKLRSLQIQLSKMEGIRQDLEVEIRYLYEIIKTLENRGKENG